MLVLGLIPGMPWLPFLAFASVLVLGGWVMAKQPARPLPAQDEMVLLQTVTAAAAQDFGWHSLPITEQLSVRVGYRLVGQLDPAQGAPLAVRLGRAPDHQRSHGFCPAPVHVRDDLTLPPNQYTVLINDTVVAKAEVHADRLMAIPSPHVYGQLDGIPGIEPAYQLPVTWIDPKDKAHALGMGYQVDCVSIVATHLTRVVRSHLDELIRHEDVHAMANALRPCRPSWPPRWKRPAPRRCSACTSSCCARVFR
jgi:flagellar biosynthesis protein FlhA